MKINLVLDLTELAYEYRDCLRLSKRETSAEAAAMWNAKARKIAELVERGTTFDDAEALFANAINAGRRQQGLSVIPADKMFRQ